MIARNIFVLLIVLFVSAGDLRAQSIVKVSQTCRDPITAGPEKLAAFAADGWLQSDASNTQAIATLATTHMASFTLALGDDWDSRKSAVAQIQANLKTQISAGTTTLWLNGPAILAFGLQQTAQNGEYISCYFASPAAAETLTAIHALGVPVMTPSQGLTLLRRDEVAIFPNDAKWRYDMFTFYSRHQSDPNFTHPDGYRLERVQRLADS